MNEEFDRWLREFGVSHHLTSPYHPQSNGMTERFNGTIQRLLLKLTGGQPRKWSDYLADALYAYRITPGPSGLSPYQSVFGQKPRLPRANMSSQEEGERLRAIRHAERILHEFRTERKSEYQKRELKRAKRLPPGTFVSVRTLNPKKGETHWRPGYQVLSSHDGALRVLELSTGNVIRINQRNVREIPESKAYDEVDPIPKSDPKSVDFASPEAKEIPVVDEPYLPTRIPICGGLQLGGSPSGPMPVMSASDEWSFWCEVVHRFTH